MKTDWVDCPICHEPDMRAVHYGEENGWYINCVNLNCPSNQVGEKFDVIEKPPKVIKGHSMYGWDQEPDCSIEAPDIEYLNENYDSNNLFTRFFRKVLTWFKPSV